MGAVNEQQPVQLRVGLAQIDTRVGDLAGNADLVREWTAKAAGDGVHLVVFPEMTLTGYPAEDLVLRESFAHASERTLVALATRLGEDGLGEIAVVVGYLAHTEGHSPAPVDHPPVDEAAELERELNQGMGSSPDSAARFRMAAEKVIGRAN